MAYVSAVMYGAHTEVTRYGEDLRASDGNGDLYGEQIEVHQTVENATNLRVQEIEYMLHLLTEHSLPGDDRLRELLVFDRAVLTAGVADRYKTVLEQYPDLPEHIVEVAANVSDPQEIALTAMKMRSVLRRSQ